jgi:hypothetical protein
MTQENKTLTPNQQIKITEKVTQKVIITEDDAEIKKPAINLKEKCKNFFSPLACLKRIFKPNKAAKDHKMRKNLSEKQIDKTLKDSFPASDPPSTY